jgi:DNA-binding SARP family transcriptional activator/tetratricopeptide (TPR) repeat protein
MIFVRTLGTAVIEAGGARITPVSARKFALLLYLSAESGRRVSRIVLRELIFSDQTPENARHSLRQLVYQLRSQGIELDTDSVGILLPTESVRSDYAEIVNNGLPDAQQLKAIESGFLPGYAPILSEAYTDWLAEYRAQAAFNLIGAMLIEIARAKSASDWQMTERAARACLAIEPLHEEATFALAEILAVRGAKAQALGLLDRYVTEVGPISHGAALPAAVLRRRIGERLPETSTGTLDFPLVGRQREMVLLNERLAMAKTGQSQCVVLHGEPGIGKSRLAAEFCSWALLGGWRVERGAAQPHDKERPMGAFVELVPGVLKLPGAIGAAPESLATLTRLTKHELRNSAIDVKSSASSDAVSAAIVRAISDVIDAVASESPLILLVEDVQWLDAESLRTLAGLVSPRRARRLLVLVTSRDRDSVRYFARHAERLASIEVGELPTELCDALVHQTIGQGNSRTDQAFRDWLVSASGGNPFFLHSLVHHYQTTGREFSVSPTINALLDQRLATLSAAAMTVLWTSVALGNHSTLDRLIAALEMPHMELVTSVRELEVGRLIVQSAQLVTPAHWLISDAVTRKATAIADKLGHRRIAAILEAESRSNNDADKLWDCAQHWLMADDTARAIEMLTQCAQHSIEIGRLREAAEVLLKAAFLASSPERHDLACKAITIAHSVAELDVVGRAAKLIDHSNRGGVHDHIEFAELSAQGVLFGENEETRLRLHECAMAPDADRSHRIDAARMLLVIADLWGGPGLSDTAFEALSGLVALGDQTNDLVSLRYLVLYHATVGDPTVCGKLSRRLIEIAQGARPEIAGDLYRYAANGLWRSGDLCEALAGFRRAFELAESVGLRRPQFLAAAALAGFSHDIGKNKESDYWMEKIERIADELPSLRGEGGYISACFEPALTRGDVVELKRLLDGATQFASRSGRALSRMARLLEITIQQLSGELSDPAAAIGELTGRHVTGGETGNVSDLEIAVAASLSENAGDGETAHCILSNYLKNYRRGPTPIAGILRDAIVRIGTGELPPWCRIYKIEE